jgi:VanZ family protein
MIIGFLYSLSDELHQSIPTRSSQWRDTGIDLLGIVLMYTLLRNIFVF